MFFTLLLSFIHSATLWGSNCYSILDASQTGSNAQVRFHQLPVEICQLWWRTEATEAREKAATLLPKCLGNLTNHKLFLWSHKGIKKQKKIAFTAASDQLIPFCTIPTWTINYDYWQTTPRREGGILPLESSKLAVNVACNASLRAYLTPPCREGGKGMQRGACHLRLLVSPLMHLGVAGGPGQVDQEGGQVGMRRPEAPPGTQPSKEAGQHPL